MYCQPLTPLITRLVDMCAEWSTSYLSEAFRQVVNINNYTSPKFHLNPSLKVQEGLKVGLLSAKREIIEVSFAVWRSHWVWICVSVGTCLWLDLLALFREKVMHWDTYMEMEAFFSGSLKVKQSFSILCQVHKHPILLCNVNCVIKDHLWCLICFYLYLLY